MKIGRIYIKIYTLEGVFRGLYFQKQYPQCKLVRAVRGEYPCDAAADGCVMDDETKLNLSEKDQKWGTLVS